MLWAMICIDFHLKLLHCGYRRGGGDGYPTCHSAGTRCPPRWPRRWRTESPPRSSGCCILSQRHCPELRSHQEPSLCTAAWQLETKWNFIILPSYSHRMLFAHNFNINELPILCQLSLVEKGGIGAKRTPCLCFVSNTIYAWFRRILFYPDYWRVDTRSLPSPPSHWQTQSLRRSWECRTWW